MSSGPSSPGRYLKGNIISNLESLQNLQPAVPQGPLAHFKGAEFRCVCYSQEVGMRLSMSPISQTSTVYKSRTTVQGSAGKEIKERAITQHDFILVCLIRLAK